MSATPHRHKWATKKWDPTASRAQSGDTRLCLICGQAQRMSSGAWRPLTRKLTSIESPTTP